MQTEQKKFILHSPFKPTGDQPGAIVFVRYLDLAQRRKPTVLNIYVQLH